MNSFDRPRSQARTLVSISFARSFGSMLRYFKDYSAGFDSVGSVVQSAGSTRTSQASTRERP